MMKSGAEAYIIQQFTRTPIQGALVEFKVTERLGHQPRLLGLQECSPDPL